MSQRVPTPDPDAAALYEARRAARASSMRAIELDAVRAGLETLPHPVDMPKMTAVEDWKIPCGHGRLPIRICSPTADAELPGIVYFHAGAMAIGSNHSLEPFARALAAYTGHRGFAVDYHLAPEASAAGADRRCVRRHAVGGRARGGGGRSAGAVHGRR
ncbi:alpha/beta hydrolase fold domain-containing protein [Streptomyces sp. NPDC055681]